MMKSALVRMVLAGGLFAAVAALFNAWLAPLAAVAAVIALSPLVRKKRAWFVGEVESEMSIIARRREESLRALKDLEEDRQVGKISQVQFESQRPVLLQAAKLATAEYDRVLQKRTEARKRIEDILADHNAA
jgi:hypothetical protein